MAIFQPWMLTCGATKDEITHPLPGSGFRETMLAAFHGTAFQVSYAPGSLSGPIISLVTLKANLFDRTAAWLRIASSICDFGLYIPIVGLYISLFSIFFLLAWTVLVAHRIFQLAR